jgi:hypothetical protein
LEPLAPSVISGKIDALYNASPQGTLVLCLIVPRGLDYEKD